MTKINFEKILSFRLRKEHKKHKVPKYLLGAYTLNFANKNNNPIESKFFKVLSVFFIILFVAIMFGSMYILGSLTYHKIAKPQTLIAKSSSLAIVVPSISKDTIRDVQNQSIQIANGEMDVKDYKRQNLIFLPFFLFIPIILIVASLHEFGHYLMCKVHKVKVKKVGFGLLSIFCIPLLPFAFVEPNKQDMKKASNFGFWSISSAGVVFNLFISVIALILMAIVPGKFFSYLFLFNTSVMIMNALPLGGLDGGLFAGRISKKLNVVTTIIFSMVLVALLI